MKKKDPKEVAIKCLEQMIQERETMLMSSHYHHRSQEYLDLCQSLGEEIERLEDTIATLKDINNG